MSKVTDKKKPAAVAALPDRRTNVQITEREKQDLEEIKQRQLNLKIQHSEIELEIRRLNNLKEEAAKALLAVGDEYVSRVKMIGVAHSLDMDNGGWTFKADESRFLRAEAPKP